MLSRRSVSDPVRALVVGFGSIGMRHARVLESLGCDVGVVSSRAVNHARRFATLAEGCATHAPEYIVVASATHLHRPQLVELERLGFAGVTLVEKPLFDSYSAADVVRRDRVYVAYNLRFHPLIARLRELLSKEQVLSVQAYAGQYLPDWRPATDYRASYSARADQGGGVLRDLSHELDYLTWMLDGWTRVTALGGHFSELEITSDDVFACLFEAPDCPAVSVQLNYLDRVGRRTIMVNTAARTYEVDLVRGILVVDRESQSFTVERDDTYREMHVALLAGDTRNACTYHEGLRTLQLIDASRSAAKSVQWVANG
jgi:predicted dehydrogenase